MRISDIIVRNIFDSRGEPTIEIGVRCGERTHTAQIPSGKSRGTREASVFAPAEAAVSARLVRELMCVRSFSSIAEIDAFLSSYDGTPAKTVIGGNVALGISIAAARALAAERKEEIWELIRKEYFASMKKDAPPLIFSNFINGGAHANNTLDIQEYLVIARTSASMRETIEKLISLYRKTGDYLKHARGLKGIPIGDEGGYSLDFEDNFKPLSLLDARIREHGLGGIWFLGIDAAASHFGGKGSYVFEGKQMERKALAERYERYASELGNLMSFEDPFGEDDAEGFSLMRRALPDRWIVGDDLTTTDAGAIRKHTEGGAINAVIIKPNQIGTVTESCKAILAAQSCGAKTIISHRSGETDDTFIIQLAKAAGADGVKIGAPVKERLTKFNELMRLYS